MGIFDGIILYIFHPYPWILESFIISFVREELDVETKRNGSRVVDDRCVHRRLVKFLEILERQGK